MVKRCYSGTSRWFKPLIWAEGPPIGLYRTTVVRGGRLLCMGDQVVVHVSRKRTLYRRSPLWESGNGGSQALSVRLYGFILLLDCPFFVYSFRIFESTLKRRHFVPQLRLSKSQTDPKSSVLDLFKSTLTFCSLGGGRKWCWIKHLPFFGVTQRDPTKG